MNEEKVMKKNNNKKNSRFKIVLMVIVSVILICGIFTGIYLNDYYHATDSNIALESTDAVNVIKIGNGYMYDGPGNDTAIVFYPGAKVEDIAYSAILKSLAENGVDCFLVHMPGNLALFGIDRMDDIMQQYNYEHWYIAGHSLGGAMAADYAYKNSEKLDGIVFLAAYSTKDLSDTGLKVLSLYGSEDRVLKMSKVEEYRKYMPSDYEEYCIQGGNHAGYADYGEQKGDGDALITAKEQQRITVDKMLKLINQ